MGCPGLEARTLRARRPALTSHGLFLLRTSWEREQHLGPARAVLAVCRGPAGLLWGAPARTAAPGPHLPWGFSGSASSHAIRAGSLTTPTGGRALEEQRRTGLVPPTGVSQTDRGWELHGCTVLILVP